MLWGSSVRESCASDAVKPPARYTDQTCDASNTDTSATGTLDCASDPQDLRCWDMSKCFFDASGQMTCANPNCLNYPTHLMCGGTVATVSPVTTARVFTDGGNEAKGTGDGFCGFACNAQSCAVDCKVAQGYYPDPNDCHSYCYCTGNPDSAGVRAPSRYETCVAGLVWDPVMNICRWAREVDLSHCKM